MEHLNTVMEKMSPHMSTLLQLLIICVESFFSNVYIAGKCLYLYFTTYSLQDFSITNYNKIVNSEIERQHNPVLSTVGIWVSMLFCFNILWTVLENLAFPMIGLTLWWMFVWSVGFTLKEKVGGLLMGKLKTA
jgi:hypothetical protein